MFQKTISHLITSTLYITEANYQKEKRKIRKSQNQHKKRKLNSNVFPTNKLKSSVMIVVINLCCH